MNADGAVARARGLFLDDANTYGCAETIFVTLKEAWGLPDAVDSSAAMALNGGVAYSGGPCGAVTGAALAVGQLAGRRVPDHVAAKRAAREAVASLMDAFTAEFGATDCRTLTGLDLRTEDGHRAFIESGVWRETCMRQIEWVVARLVRLADDPRWPSSA